MNREKTIIPRKSGKLIAATLVLCFVFALSGCDRSVKPSDDEIMLQIKLDIKEDIGLLIVDYAAGDTACSGGISNADQSLLKHDELLTYTLNKQDFDKPADAENMSIRFTVITEYEDPNYENIYTPEYTKPMEAISLNAHFGETYAVAISGDKINGYKAVLEP